MLSLSILASTALAQRGSIKGVILDSISKAPIERATIAIFNQKDTSLIAYTLSQKDGSFKLSALPIDISNSVTISIMGYTTFRKALKLKPNVSTDLGPLTLIARSLREVVIKGERTPISVKKDTIEFDAEVFKTRPNAVVEDLLRLLPGVQVNYDGSILVNGKKVNRLLIDGKRFFGNDPKVATKNLDADMLDKIQVYDDREDDPDHKLSDKDVGKVINLKMKNKIKKSTLGKLYGGIGTRGRYEVGGILSNFRDTLQVSLIGLSNNLNSTGFSQDELYTMGGFNRSQSGQYYDGTFGGQNWGGGIQSITSGGLNVNNDYGERLRMNLTYFYTGTNTVNTSKNQSQQTTDQTVLNSQYQGSNNNISRKQAIGGTIEWKPDSNMRILYTPNFSFQTSPSTYIYAGSTSNIQGPITSSFTNQSGDDNSNNFGHNFMFYHKLGHKGKSITLNQSISLNNTGNSSYSLQKIVSYVSSIQTQLLDRLDDQGSVNNTFGLSANYYHPITKKIIAELNTNSRYLLITGKEFVFDKNQTTGLYTLFNDSLGKNLVRHWFVQNIKPVLTYKFKDDISIKVGLDFETQNVTNYFNIDTVRNINKKYFLLFPSVELNVKSFSASYTEAYDVPGIDNMLPITRVYNALYKVTGNADLMPSRTHDFRLNYYKYNNDKQLNISFWTWVTLLQNAIISKTTIDAVGAHTTNFVNRNSSIRENFGGNIDKQFKARQKWQMGLSNSFGGSLYKAAFFLNADEGTQYDYRFNTTQNINFNYNKVLSINTNYQFTIQSTRYKEVNYATVNTLTHTVGSDISVRWPVHFVFEAKYNYNYRPQVGQGFQRSSNIVNLAVTLLMLKKDKGQLKLSVYDLFDQNISVYRYAGQNSITTSEQQILKRYFTATYQYKFSSYKSK
ncbi:outer membrane beta-barrel protein [Mucilaginibacter antarcticus]|uniref:Outer membrane beta-barrel protein n=2 Tax=Mucilaginibacter antarcticus TaxID=1855725 RepID=A0ABW5XV63_9SPHI